jgi:hypothetical protein
MAPQATLSEPCRERRAQAARVGPTMPATSACGSGYGRRQGSPVDVAPPVSYALHAARMPSFSLDRVAHTRTGRGGAARRALAERRRPPLLAPGGV